MSRLRKLNKKKKIRTTISGLALMIAIGASGGVGSYAWFVANGEANSDLVVNMGSLNVSITDVTNSIVEGIESQDTEDIKHKPCPPPEIEPPVTNPEYVDIHILNKTFKIKNDGSLKQDLSIKFTPSILTKEGKEIDINELNLTYKVEIRGNDIGTINRGDLNPISISNLQAGDVLDCFVIVTVPKTMAKENRLKIQEGNIKLSISVDANQINMAEGGN